MTNYKKIKKMSKKKMTEFLVSCCEGCEFCAYFGNCNGEECKKGVRKWLKSEVER